MGTNYIKLHLIIHSLLKFEEMWGSTPSMIELMCWFERPMEDIQQAFDAVNMIRRDSK